MKITSYEDWLVKQNVKKYSHVSFGICGIDDIKNAGLFGLWKARQQFNGNGCYESYANMMIQFYIQNYMRSVLSIPSGEYFRVLNLSKEQNSRQLTEKEKTKIVSTFSLVRWHSVEDVNKKTDEKEELEKEEIKEFFIEEGKRILPENEYKILIAYLNGLTYMQIGEEIGVSHNLVCQKIKGIVKRFRVYMQHKEMV